MQNVLAVFMALLATTAMAGVPDGSLLEGVVPGPDGKIDVMTIFPHPDDEVDYSGGTLLKLKSDPRVRVQILCMTLGDLSPAKDNLGITPEKMAQVRSAELEAAASVINADRVIQWDYPDQGLPKADPEELRRRILEAIRQAEAEVIIGYGPEGITGHPDHIAGHARLKEVFAESGAQKLYYVNVPRAMYPVYRLYSKMTPLPATLKVDIRCCRKLRKLMTDEHASQKYFIGWIEKAEFNLIFGHEYFTLAGAGRDAENPQPR